MKGINKYVELDDLNGLMRFISCEFGVIKTRFEDLEGTFKKLESAVDIYAKRADTYLSI